MPKGAHLQATDEETFIRLLRERGAAGTARVLGINDRAIFSRRRSIEQRLGIRIEWPESERKKKGGSIGSQFVGVPLAVYEPRLRREVHNGVVLIGSDSHYWPGRASTAHRGFVKLCKELKPKLVIKNGDELDASTISRFPPIGWEKRPSLIEELETVQERLAEIRDAAGKAERFWPLGNHDARFESRLAQVAPEYAKIHGVHLKDHFPDWTPCWAMEINDDIVVKHRFKGGIHVPHNNTLWAGKSIFTGHLHALNVVRFSDYRGYRWGADGGTMADVYGPQFIDYTEDNPKNWASGFIVLFFEHGHLRWPQVVHAYADGKIEFMGKTIEV